MRPVSAGQVFVLFRIALGLYVSYYFLSLLPYVSELIAQPLFLVRFALAFLGATGILFAFGFWRRSAALLLWLGWIWATTRILWLHIPSDGYIGWLLLACVFIPGGESWTGSGNWTLPRPFFLAAWYLSGLSYTLSGLTKLESPLWQNGEALAIVLAGPIARDSGKWLLDLGPLLRILSYVSLALEILAGPLAFLRLGRKIAWISLTLFHTGILVFLNVGSVSLAMLVLQLYLFDSDWLASLRLRRRIAESIRARRTSQAQPYQSIP
ncbi:MAG: hypothetical protein HS115_12335 [Spirochaetales bacterium]|nr:hypothetical protein [Spirochaetales bacterium]